jgi:hypothetical protein
MGRGLRLGVQTVWILSKHQVVRTGQLSGRFFSDIRNISKFRIQIQIL